MKKSRKVKNSLWLARKKMGFSQRRVAMVLGLRTTSLISRYESGKRIPSLTNALKLEIVYRTPVSFLFTDFYGEIKKEIQKKEEKLGRKGRE